MFSLTMEMYNFVLLTVLTIYIYSWIIWSINCERGKQIYAFAINEYRITGKLYLIIQPCIYVYSVHSLTIVDYLLVLLIIGDPLHRKM